MAGKNVRIGALRYDIIADSSLYTRGVSKAAKMSRKLAKDVALTRTPLERYKKELLQARRALKANLIDERAYAHAKQRLRKQYIEENRLIDKNTGQVKRNTRALIANRRAGGTAGGGGAGGRINLANVGGAAASMFGGRGGAAIGRGIGIGAMAGGLQGAALSGLFAGSFAVTRMVEEFGKLEEAATDLKVFLGDEVGEEVSNSFRKIARETSLTTEGLIKNARVWASYGLETDNIVQQIYRLGIAAGGEKEAFDSLTLAMAQVNATGRLMGQEKNQLVNAGFDLKLIADEAGVSMTNFAKAMESGAISADHVNAALFKATSEGGLYFGRLEAKAKTLNGQLDLVANNFNDLFANLGEQGSGVFSAILTQLNDTLSEVSKVVSEANELERLRAQNRPAGTGGSGDGESGIAQWMRGIAMSFGEMQNQALALDTSPGDILTGTAGLKAAANIGGVLGAGLITFFDEITMSAEESYAKRQAEMQRERAKIPPPTAEELAQRKAEERAKEAEKAEMQAMNFIVKRAELEKQFASEEEKQMRERQKEFDEFVQSIKGKVGGAIEEQDLMQLKKDLMTKEARDAIAEDGDKKFERQQQKLMDALGVAGPGQMRQNSVEEWVYLKQRRDASLRELREEQRYEEERQEQRQQHLDTIAAIESLQPTEAQQPDAIQVFGIN